MGPLSRLFGGAMLATAVGVPYVASNHGWGLSSERNAKIMQEVQQKQAYCPPRYRTFDGKCRQRAHRSYFLGRSHRGGGFRGGK